MGFMTFLAVPGLVIASFILAFAIAAAWESHTPVWSGGVGRVALGMLFLIICLSLILAAPPAISPIWLQYLLLIGVPLIAGFAARRAIALRWSKRSQND
ncbi:hypothetical protein [Microbacterium mangrovi]|uniref:hypothetical protein n=1 Tax=Microbacterium mangrovi TaxID=1348253 RepID=UPI000B17D675|nr:hypothetical protein [Microbacterium mangrovi]